MGQEQWLEAGYWLLEHYFDHLDIHRQEFVFGTHGSGRRSVDPADIPLSRRFEAFSRVFILVGHLLSANHELHINGIDVVEFFADSVVRYLSPESPRYIGPPQEGKSPFQLVQWVGLLLGFWSGGHIVWDSLSDAVRARALENLSACAHHRTNAHNWRFFNVLAMTFLAEQNYPVDETAEQEHLEQLLSWYAGDGWYRDGHDFDYYNAWAFQFYAALWSSRPRATKYPKIREILLRRFRDFIGVYPRFFSAQGHSFLWGRSSLYRFAASAPFAAAFLLDEPHIAPAVARRIMSGNLLQFLARADTFEGGVPSMGFYGPFNPMIQRYSAPGSFGWMHKAFLCLSLPSDSEFWNSTEAGSAWTVEHSPEVTNLSGPGLTVANYGPSGACVLVPGKVRATSDMCYNRLAYHSALLPEADNPNGTTAMAYSAVKLDQPESETLRTARIRYAGFNQGVLYRQLFLGEPGGHHSEGLLIDLADIFLPGGILRVDRVRASFRYKLRLGSFGVPGTCDSIAHPDDLPYPNLLLGPNLRAAETGVVAIRGWDTIDLERHTGLHAEAEKTSVVSLTRTANLDRRGGIDLLVSFHLIEVDANTIVPDVKVQRLRSETGSPWSAQVTTRDGMEYMVDFNMIEGTLSE